MSETFLKMGADPDSAALAGSVLSGNRTPAGMITNPAALSYNYQPKLSFTNTMLPGDIKYNFAGIAVPLKFGTISAGAAYIDYGAIQGYDVNALPYTIPRSAETSINLSYAIPIKAEVPVLKEYGGVGINVKFVHGDLAGYTSDFTVFDVGGVYNMPFIARGVSAGLVMRNIGQGPEYAKVSQKLPVLTSLAVRYDKPSESGFFAVADIAQDQDNSYLSLGLGASPVYPLKVMCGWKVVDRSAASGLNAGFGVDFNNISLRYAVSPMKDMAPAHTMAIDIAFESFTNPQAAYDHYLGSYYEQAREKFNKRDYIASRDIFEEILSVYPGHLPSKEYLLKINAELDRMEQRQQVQVDRWLRKAGVALDRNDVFKARKYYSLVLNIDSENIEAMEGLNKIRGLLGEYETAEDVDMNKARINKLWVNAVGFYDKGDFVVAREKFQEILRIDPNNEEAARYLNDIFNQLNRINALQESEMFNKGVELYGQGKYDEAKKYFNSVVISNPERTDAKEYAAACQNGIEEQKKKAAAEKDAYKNVRVKNEVESMYFAATKLYKQGNYEEAIKVFTKTRDLAQNNDFTKYAEGSKHHITASRNALAEQYYKKGYTQYKSNEYESAAEYFAKALDLNPEFTSAKAELDRVNDLLAQQYYEAGMKAYSDGDTDKARELFQRSLTYKFDKVESIRALERIK